MKILYCTNEPTSPIDRQEIARLQAVGDVMIVCASDSQTSEGQINGEAPRLVRLQSGPRRRKAIGLWLKLLTLVSRLPHSRIGERFPERNIYQKSRLLQQAINLAWKLKRIAAINRLLPRFSTLAYYLPFRRFEIEHRTEVLSADMIVYNSLPIMSADFLPLVIEMRKRGARRVANVRSWDNPYYVQFDSSATDYLVWSDFMAKTVGNAQKTSTGTFHSWGPNILRTFVDAPRTADASVKGEPGILNIGYAAAFGDTIVTLIEYKLMLQIAARLRAENVAFQILYRPYPTVDVRLFEAAGQDPDIVLCDIGSPALDRYGDGRETIRYGSPEEKMRFLNSCDVFLSLGTTFTLEALLQGTPIVHFYLPDPARETPEAKLVFNRIEVTCDHFFDYLAGAVDFIESYEDLGRLLRQRKATASANGVLFGRLGIEFLHEPNFLRG